MGCKLIPALPRVDLSDPAWRVLEGQAVWRAKTDAPELAGEFLLATNVNHAVYFQFSKPPFPMIVAQSGSKGWQLEIPTQGRRYSGPGAPPTRIIWLRLPALLRGEPPPKHWSWSRSGKNWTLENTKTGESIEGVFTTNHQTKAPRTSPPNPNPNPNLNLNLNPLGSGATSPSPPSPAQSGARLSPIPKAPPTAEAPT